VETFAAFGIADVRKVTADGTADAFAEGTLHGGLVGGLTGS
jgi:outer membrane lipoprotein SlyB